jgi:hypothetical protein
MVYVPSKIMIFKCHSLTSYTASRMIPALYVIIVVQPIIDIV